MRRRDVLCLALGAALCSPARATHALRKSSTLLLTGPIFLLHDPGAGHPEQPARMRAIDAALSTDAFATLKRSPIPSYEDIDAAILRAHSQTHLDRVRAAGSNLARLPYAFDHDTILSSGSLDASLRGISAGLYAVDQVMDRDAGVANVFCQIRPPGHHAERERAMGFCFFNTIAIAALHARAKHGVERIAILDFDVHHGNGTQQIFWSDENTFYGSTHQMPMFPGTGALTETGVGNIFNAPLRAGDDGVAFRAAMQERILPNLDAFRPDLILLSAGFDAHLHDPLARLRLLETDFEWITLKTMELAQRHCQGRIVSFLEGGYNLDALARSTAVHVATLMQAT